MIFICLLDSVYRLFHIIIFSSGAEDKHGYIWDRHYGVCLSKFRHEDVVNCVAFSPSDSEILVTVSDDCTIKIWRSLNREKSMKFTGLFNPGLYM